MQTVVLGGRGNWAVGLFFLPFLQTQVAYDSTTRKKGRLLCMLAKVFGEEQEECGSSFSVRGVHFVRFIRHATPSNASEPSVHASKI